MKYVLLILLSLFSTLIAQNFSNSIEGKITEEGSGEPLAGVNVYFSETTIGIMSDSDGNYRIKNIRPGYYDLVVSCIGYESNNYRLEIKRNQKINIDFQMKIKAYSFGEVIVKTESPDEWLAKFEIFKRTFLGQTDFTDLCEIKNYEKINFENTKEGFEASIPEPMIVTNQALGYNIYIELVHYDYSENKDQWKYEIKPWFNDLDSNTTSVQLHNRIEAYHGSEREFWNNYDSLFAESSNYFIGFDRHHPIHNHTALLPNKDPYMNKATMSDNPNFTGPKTRKLVFKSIFVQYRPSYFDIRESTLTPNQDTLTIDQNGYPKEAYPYGVSGYWSTLGIANLLPRDYYIQNEKRDKMLQEELDREKNSYRKNWLRKRADITNPSK